jgi:hypothetical protein
MSTPHWITPPPDFGPLFDQAKPAATGAAAGEACLAKAERVAGFDAAAARGAILELLADGVARSGEQLVDHCTRAGIVPHDGRAFGPVLKSLAGGGLIEAVGFVTRAKGHGTAGGRLWRITGKGATDGDGNG